MAALVYGLIMVALMLPSVGVSQNSPERTAALREVQKADNLMALLIWQDALFAYDNAIALDPTFA